MKISKNDNVLIISHYYVRNDSMGGPPQELRNFLLNKVNIIVYIEHPFPYANDKRSFLSVYEKGKLKSQYNTTTRSGHEILLYLADFWINAFFIIKTHVTFTVCISLDCLNTINTIPFRFLGLINKHIFYTIDYVPNRFQNKFLNFLYHLTDRIACQSVDAIWVLSQKMTEMRQKRGIKKMATTIVIPMGANLSRIKPAPLSDINRHQIVFVGHLLEKQGLQLIMHAMPDIAKKIKDVQLLIIGKGEYESTLRTLSANLHLENKVKFLGFIENHETVEKILCNSAVGLAPYKPEPDNYTFFTDPGKPKIYLGCGLPVIITDVPPIAKIIHAQHAGFIVHYEVQSISKSIIKLLSDDTLYINYRKNALNLAKSFDTNSLIAHAFDSTD